MKALDTFMKAISLARSTLGWLFSTSRRMLEGTRALLRRTGLPGRRIKTVPPARTADPQRGATEGGEGNFLWRNLRFIIRNRMYGINYWRSLYRFCKFRIRHPEIRTDGFVFLPKKYEFQVGKGAEISIGAFTFIGENCAFRAHAGTLRIGRKCAFGGNDTVNCYGNIEIGDENLWADNIYVVDFDHWYLDPHKSIRSQGLRIEHVIFKNNVWVGEKCTVLRGVTVGEGSVIGAMSLVSRDVPDYAVVGGVPARILKYRRSPADVAWDEGEG